MKEYAGEIKKIIEVLRNKGTILYPTDTIWGIGCDATSPEAVNKIFDIKKRSDEKNLILLLDHESKLQSYLREIPETAWQLIEYSEKPLTIIYEGAKNLPIETVAADGSIAIRITRDEYCRSIIQALKKPLVSTSANISGKPAPLSFDDIDDDIKSKVDYICEWRQAEKMNAKPSTIIRLATNGRIEFIRQ